MFGKLLTDQKNPRILSVAGIKDVSGVAQLRFAGLAGLRVGLGGRM